MKIKLLYVEDEESLGKIIYDSLCMHGFDVFWVTDGAKVMTQFEYFQPDVCILDIMLPNVDGYEICKEIRLRNSKVPILFLTAKTETEDLVEGFEAGGTDYIKKPFSIEELVVRINNQVKIHGIQASGEYTTTPDIEEIKIGTYTYFPERFELIAPSGLIKLSNRDGELLWLMVGKGSQIINRKEILMKIWGDDSFFNSRNLDVYIKKMRNYFKEDPNIEIQTLRGKGYLFLIKQ